MIFEAKAALVTFIGSAFWSGLPFVHSAGIYIAVLYYLILASLHVYILAFVAWKYFEIFWRAYSIGALFVLGIALILYFPVSWRAFGVYACVVAFFHISEYLCTALFNPSSLRLESFLINHSFAYNLAHMLCLTEYVIWWLVYPDIKLNWAVQLVGFCFCAFGEIFRKLAMYTAGVSFTHIIQYEKRQEHVLVTNGIYSICRHPSYAGWFYWSIATQILTCNPICFIGYCFTSWKFFDERIYAEEQLLLNFFGEEYLKYQNKVATGVPFVQGYKIKYRSK